MIQWDYHTPDAFQNLRMCSDGTVLTGLWFVGSPDEKKHATTRIRQHLPIFQETERWLDLYFSGKQPDFTPAYTMLHLTAFRQEVMERLKAIPYGQTTTYGAIAKQIAAKKGNFSYVCTSGRRSSWMESDWNHCSLSSGHWSEWSINWIRWRSAK